MVRPVAFTHLLIHMVISIKSLDKRILPENRDEIFKHISDVIQTTLSTCIAINGVTDHVHILVNLNPSLSLRDFVSEVRRSSAFYISRKKWYKGKFEWQQYYTAFTISYSQLNEVKQYLANQENYHQQESLMDEILKLRAKYPASGLK